MSFDEPYSQVAIGEMKHELESILRSSRVQIQWRVLDASVPKESFASLLVARFHGGCHSVEEEPPLQIGALGHTHVSDGDILPFSDIDCTKVRRFVQPEIRSMNLPRSEKMLGRALGRVLAHEVYHIIGRTRHHAESGIAKAFLTARELVQGSLSLERNESALIRKRFEARPLPLSVKAPRAPETLAASKRSEPVRGSEPRPEVQLTGARSSFVASGSAKPEEHIPVTAEHAPLQP